MLQYQVKKGKIYVNHFSEKRYLTSATLFSFEKMKTKKSSKLIDTGVDASCR